MLSGYLQDFLLSTSCIIWDCEPLFFVLKIIEISCIWFVTRIMRITGARLVCAFEDKPKSRVRLTIVQLLIGASLVLVVSLHLSYPEHEAISFVEMAPWVCFLVDVLWHFAIWKTTTKRVFQGVKGMTIKSYPGRTLIHLVHADLLLQDKSSECKPRNSVGSHRLSAFGFPGALAVHITLCVGRRQVLQGSYVNQSVS
jgi:hypothetical protein